MGKKPLSRTFIAVIVTGFLIPIFSLVYEMTWWIKLILIIFSAISILIIIDRSEWTIEKERWKKIGLSAVAIIILAISSYFPIRNQYIKEHPTSLAKQQVQPKTEQKQPEELLKPQMPIKRPVQKKEPKQKELTFKELPLIREKSQLSFPSAKESPTDVALRFVYPKSPALIITNLSDSVARDIKWSVVLWNIDLPDRNDPLPIPTQTFDWMKGHDEGAPLDLFSSPLVSPLLKNGNRLLGSALVDCPTCTRGRSYIVYIVWGQEGWFSEVENKMSGKLLIPINFLRESRERYFKALEAMVPEKSRLPIGER